MRALSALLACFVSMCHASMKIELEYSVSLLPPVTGKFFSGQVSKNRLLCFGNQDYHEDTYLESFLCMVQWRFDSHQPSKSCFGLWGTRNIMVDVDGSVEFIRLKKLPRESDELDKTILEAEHWLHLSNIFETHQARETVRVTAEPMYICARSNLWGNSNTTSTFNLQFRNAYIRYADRIILLQQTFVQSLAAFGMTFPVIGPFIGSLSAAKAFYVHGLNYFIVIFSTCVSILLSAPLMFNTHTRRSSRAAFHLLYFSREGSLADTDISRLPPRRVYHAENSSVGKECAIANFSQRMWLLYQSLYLSSLIVCGGAVCSYALFCLLGIERETRNNIIRVSLGMSAASFFYFFLAKLFPDFSRRYMWMPFSYYALFSVVRDTVNSQSQDEVMQAIFVILAVSNVLFRRVSRMSFISRVQRDIFFVLKSLLRVSISAGDPSGGDSANVIMHDIAKIADSSPERIVPVQLRLKLAKSVPGEEAWDGFEPYLAVMFLRASDKESISSLHASAARLGPIRVKDNRDWRMKDDGRLCERNKYLEQTVVYTFLTPRETSDQFVRISELSISSCGLQRSQRRKNCHNSSCSSSSKDGIQHSRQGYVDPFDCSLRSSIDCSANTVTLCIRNQSTSSSCEDFDREDNKLFQIIKDIKQHLDLPPSSISAQASPHPPRLLHTTKILQNYTLSAVIQESFLCHVIDVSRIEAKTWVHAVEQNVKCLYEVLCFSAMVPCPRVDVTACHTESTADCSPALAAAPSSDTTLTLSAHTELVDLNTLGTVEVGAILQRMREYGLVSPSAEASSYNNDMGDERDITIIQNSFAKISCVSALVVCLTSLQ